MASTFLQRSRRVSALLGVVIVSLAASSARAQSSLDNLFGGTVSNASATASVLALGFGVTDSGSVPLGADYTGRVILPGGVLGTVSESVNSAASPNALTVTATGVTLGSTFTATRDFTGVNLLPNTQYVFSLSTGTASVQLFGGLGFALSLNNTQFANTTTGLGLLNLLPVNVLGLLSDGSAAFTFTTPAVVPAGSTLNVAVNGNLGVSVGLGTASYSLTNASIALAPVPEPTTTVSAMLGVVGLAAWHFRRRARLA